MSYHDGMAYPLHWPPGQPRTEHPIRSKFDRHTVKRALDEIENQLVRMQKDSGLDILDDDIVSSNIRGIDRRVPKDKGVALYFTIGDEPTVLACDQYDRVECNLWAIAKDLEAARARMRWGVTTAKQMFHGQRYEMLGSGNWREVLGVGATKDFQEVKRAYRLRSKDAHPDHGGSEVAMARLNAAYDAAKAELGA